MKKWILNLAKILVSAGLLAVLFATFDPAASFRALVGIRLSLFGVAFVLFQFTLLIRSFRWRFLLEAVDVHIPLSRLLYLYYVGTFFNTFLPSGFGGDAVKMYELSQYSRRVSESVGTVLVDRLAGLIVLFLMSILAWPFAWKVMPRPEAYILLAVSLAGVAGSWLLFQEKWARRVLSIVPGKVGKSGRKLYETVHACGRQALWKAMAVSVLFNLCLFALNYCLASALGRAIPVYYFVLFMPLISLSMTVPSVGALGTRESAYVLLFGIAGIPEPLAIAMSLAFYLVNVFTGLIGALLYIMGTVKGLRASETHSEG